MEMGSVSVNQQVQEDNVVPDSMVTPKSKLTWTTELNSSFMREVINLGGIEEAKPAKILNAMNVPGLKRASVASHLQKVRGLVRKGGYKRFSRLPRNHQYFIQCQRSQQNPPVSYNTEGSTDHSVPENSYLLAAADNISSIIFEQDHPAALFNTNSSHHASYNTECEKLPGDPDDDFVSAQGRDQENDFFAGLNPNHFGYSTAGQENNPMPSFSVYATNQETAVQTQFVPPTPAAALSNTNSNREGEKLQGGADDLVSAQGGDQENGIFGGLSPILNLNDFDYITAEHEMQLFSAYAPNQETAVHMQFVPSPTPLPSPTQLDGHYDFASKSWKW